MSKICDVCGLPEELCVCEEIAREVQTVKVFTVRRRFGKLMTIIEGIDEHDIDIKELTKTLKAKCACGGTAKNSQIELQGDHKVKVKEVLSEKRYEQSSGKIKPSPNVRLSTELSQMSPSPLIVTGYVTPSTVAVPGTSI